MKAVNYVLQKFYKSGCGRSVLTIKLVERQKAGFENIAGHCGGEKLFWVVNPSVYQER